MNQAALKGYMTGSLSLCATVCSLALLGRLSESDEGIINQQ
jgi:hypothetical protein